MKYLVHILCLFLFGVCLALEEVTSECGENEVFREWGPLCEKCSCFPSRVNTFDLPTCYCKEGYKRDESGKCILADKCPPRTHCLWNEELKDSGPVDEFCQRSANTTNSTQEKTQCYCKEGHERNNFGYCFKEKNCRIIHCLPYETYQECPRKCNTTCKNYGDPNCVEDGQCYPGCFCPEGFYINDKGFCKTLEECQEESNAFDTATDLEIETTLPSSVTNETQENEGSTTPTSVTESLSTPAESEDEDYEDLPQNLPDEDIVPEKKDSKSTPAPKTKTPSGKSQTSSQNDTSSNKEENLDESE